jgi:hypothetical protein
LLNLFQNEYARRDYPLAKRKLEADDVYREALADPNSLLQQWMDEARRLEQEHEQGQQQAAAAAARMGFPHKGRGRGATAAPCPRNLPGAASSAAMLGAGIQTSAPASEVGFFGLGGLSGAGAAEQAPAAGRFRVKFSAGSWILVDTQNNDLSVALPALDDEGQGYWEITPDPTPGSDGLVLLSQGGNTDLLNPMVLFGYDTHLPQGMVDGSASAVRIPPSSDEEEEEAEPEQEDVPQDPTTPSLYFNEELGQWIVIDPVSNSEGALPANDQNDYFAARHPTTNEWIIDSVSAAVAPSYVFKVLGYKRTKTLGLLEEPTPWNGLLKAL